RVAINQIPRALQTMAPNTHVIARYQSIISHELVENFLPNRAGYKILSSGDIIFPHSQRKSVAFRSSVGVRLPQTRQFTTAILPPPSELLATWNVLSIHGHSRA